MKIDFSKENLYKLSDLLNRLTHILISSGFDIYVDYLFKIGLEAANKDEYNFLLLINNNALLGGSGALWEIYIEDSKRRKEFIKELFDFFNHLKRMGVKNSRLNQISITLHKMY